ncbi:hypothetical protein HPB51_017851 [Rhipicephalus microplus]|uniref:Sulfotransferase domain-containing protein n=1 Tax=Rhipicephalus microplus TaxID=6941 RepID=A0A9J6E3B1_RHIMP|nr:hypothetical protein HPB51_017851 [Rhipicephalus microplus]
MQQIVYNILTDGNIPEDKTDAVLRLPFLEIQGADAAAHSLKPGAFKTHLPFWLNPYSPDAKYIYVARNPYDCCVSFYHHTKNFAVYHYEDGTFDDFLDKFVDGKVDFGDYFDHLLSWYGHRDDPNVLSSPSRRSSTTRGLRYFALLSSWAMLTEPNCELMKPC